MISTRSQILKIFHISISQMRSRSKAMINVRTISFYLGVRSLPLAIKVLQQGKLNKVEEEEEGGGGGKTQVILISYPLTRLLFSCRAESPHQDQALKGRTRELKSF